MTGSVYTAFAARAAAAPGAPCVQDAGGVLDRAGLLEAVNGIAAALDAHQPADEIVGVCLERDHRLAATLLAVNAVGAAYLPLDVSVPVGRLRTFLLDSGARLLVTTPELAARLGDGPWTVVDVAAGACRATGWAPGEPTDADRIAYVMYTSGSTGRPKGVAVGHHALDHFLASLDTDLGSPEQQIWQGVASVGFDASVVDYLWTLSRGNFLVIGPGDPLSLFDSVLVTGTALGPVTHLLITPSTARLLAYDPEALAGLRRARMVLFGGEPFPTELIGLLRPDGRGPALFDGYGPTEATVWVSRDVITAETSTVSVGNAIPELVIRLLGPDLRPVRQGTEGRIFVSGPSVAFGYWARSGQTAAAFVPDPFTGGGTRMYDTGDLGVREPDGALRLVGRADHQVKIRGNRVELPEIEHVLCTSPRIREAACLLRPDEGLIAFVVPADRDDGDGVEAGVLPWLADRLPAYMQPNRMIVVGELPRMPSGKLDRGALLASQERTR